MTGQFATDFEQCNIFIERFPIVRNFLTFCPAFFCIKPSNTNLKKTTIYKIVLMAEQFEADFEQCIVFIKDFSND